MKNISLFSAAVFLGLLSVCTFAIDKANRLPSALALPGTSTAVVGIALDKTGFPVETVREVVLLPGQKVIFAGPDRFSIVFKGRKFPGKKVKYESVNGVVSISIPKDVLDRSEFIEEYRKNKSVTFNYAINVNGRELDPPMVIKREN